MTSDHTPQERVDFLMAVPKTMVGQAEWQSTEYVGQRRWLSPLSFSGLITRMVLIVDSYPNYPVPKTHIILTYGSCVSRADIGPTEMHNNHEVNGLPIPPGVPAGMIRGTHCHSWADNRELCQGGALPQQLEWARLLPPNTQRFENIFRWFCGECNILCGSNEMPELPPRETLL